MNRVFIIKVTCKINNNFSMLFINNNKITINSKLLIIKLIKLNKFKINYKLLIIFINNNKIK